MLNFRVFLLIIISFFTYTDEGMPKNDFHLVCDGKYTDGTKSKWLFYWDSAVYQLYSSELYDYDIDAFLYDDEYSFNSNVPNKEDGVYYFRGVASENSEAEISFQINRETLVAKGSYEFLEEYYMSTLTWGALCEISNYEELEKLYLEFEVIFNDAEVQREEAKLAEEERLRKEIVENRLP